MKILEGIEPKKVFEYFEELCSVPRGSRNSAPVAGWLVSVAVRLGLDYTKDKYDNVIIRKKASMGYEDAPPVILQGHTDMVCEKDASVDFDFEKDPLRLCYENGVISATGTTLGADNGIAVAMMLAILSDDTLCHPKIEALFTSNEEIGMIGAMGLDASSLEGRRLVNIDSEDEGVFTLGCAGGNVTECVLPIRREAFDGKYYKVSVTGLLGGHSGTEINKGRANANILMSRVLSMAASAAELRICSVSGGTKDNAIPCEAEAVVAVKDEKALSDAVGLMQQTFANEYKKTDPDILVSFMSTAPQLPTDAESTLKTLSLVSVAPNGVQEMSRDIDNLVETSLNLGILSTGHEEVRVSYCVRSSVESRKLMITERLSLITKALGGYTSVSGDYPAWEYKAESSLRDLISGVFRQQYGRDPVCEIIHAGLECGILSSKIENLDCISIGPDLKDIHTCREHFLPDSVLRVWNLLIEVLEKMK